MRTLPLTLLSKLPTRQHKAHALELVDRVDAALGSLREVERYRNSAIDRRSFLLDLQKNEKTVEIERELKDIAFNVARYNSAAETFSRAWSDGSALVGAIADFLEHADRLVPVDLPKPRRSLEVVRAEIADLRQKRERIGSAPLPKAELVEGLTAQVERLASRYRPTVRRTNASDPIGLSELSDQGVTGLLISLFADEIIDRLSTRIPEDTSVNLTASQRTAALAKVETELLALEREEEAAIQVAEAGGGKLNRRPDADPRAVLGVDHGN